LLDQVTCESVVSAVVEDDRQVLQFLIMEWVDDTQALKEFWCEEHRAGKHPRKARLG
jgi:hypothetical protein